MSLKVKGLNDSDIIKQASLGNKGAYRELLRKYGNLALAVAYARSGNRDKARAAAADAFVEASRELSKLPDSAPIPPWLATIARTAASKQMQETRRRSITTEAAVERVKGELEDSETGGTPDNEKKNELAVLAFDALADQEREALCLMHIYSNKYVEIAQAMAAEASSVDEYIASARNKLAEILKPLFGKGP